MSGSFFAELKRRNVYKVAVAYAVVAWLLIQAASIVFPTFEAPSWVMKVVVAVVGQTMFRLTSRSLAAPARSSQASPWCLR
jgi:hypothetical protein